MIKAWIEAARLRTLPLALASIGMGSFLAAASEQFSWAIFGLTALTTIFLQVLSNLANDYGDTINGADSVERTGPKRAVQSGAISPQAMFRAVILFAMLSLLSGLALLYIAVNSMQVFWLFLGFGILAIIAAYTYTAGSNPYGYAGLGDISVLLFFGWLAVLGTYFLHTQAFHWDLLLPATTLGLFSVGVLNINNIRDIESDQKAGKYSIPVRIGRANAVKYHIALLVIGLLCSIVYVGLHFENWTQLLFLVVVPLLVINVKAVKTKTISMELDPYLKQMALTTLLFVITFGIGQLV